MSILRALYLDNKTMIGFNLINPLSNKDHREPVPGTAEPGRSPGAGTGYGSREIAGSRNPRMRDDTWILYVQVGKRIFLLGAHQQKTMQYDHDDKDGDGGRGITRVSFCMPGAHQLPELQDHYI